MIVSDAKQARGPAQLGGVPRRPRGTSLGMGLLVASTAVAPPTALVTPTLIWSRGGGTRTPPFVTFPPEGPGNSRLSQNGVLSSPASSVSEPAGSSESESSRRIQEPWSGSSSSKSAVPTGWLRRGVKLSQQGSLLGSSGDLLTLASESGTKEAPPGQGQDGKVSGGPP